MGQGGVLIYQDLLIKYISELFVVLDTLHCKVMPLLLVCWGINNSEREPCLEKSCALSIHASEVQQGRKAGPTKRKKDTFSISY